ncbi:MAG: MBOAT family protein [Kiritimatiellia bacterium]
MLFATYTFAVFLAAVWLLHLALPLRGRQILLLAASYLFYCWETPVYGLLIFASTALDYLVGLGLERTERPLGRKALLGASLLGNLGMLGFFKYGDFAGANLVGLGRLLGFAGQWEPMGFILPVGISFYTFQTLSYSIDVYKRQLPAERSLWTFALYVCYFPQLVAGPIERAPHLLPQLRERHAVRLDNLVAGAKRILTGLFLKLVVADRLGILVDSVFAAPGTHSAAATWLALVAFGGQIYFDFASYAGIAIGTSRLFGIQLRENFHRPLVSASIAEFWNRWHMTLTRWFHDYVFLPLGGFRKGGTRAIVNAAAVLVLCGLWHGARWNFVFWGLYHAVLLTGYYLWKFYRKRHGRRARPAQTRFTLGVGISVAVTFLCNIVGLVFFRSPDVATIGQIFRACMGVHAGPVTPFGWPLGGFAALIAGWLAIELAQEYGGLNEKWARLPWPVRAAAWGALVVLTYLGAVNQQAPYIYFQF